MAFGKLGFAMPVIVFSVIYSSSTKAELPVVEDSCDQELMDSINLSSHEVVYKKLAFPMY